MQEEVSGAKLNLIFREAEELKLGSDGYKWSDTVCHNTDTSDAHMICQPSHS
jgi:hypothetical protein